MSRPRRLIRTSRLRRLRATTAAVVATLLVAANLLAFWHQATVAHARCADHGELVHVGGGADLLASGARAADAGRETDDGGAHLLGRSWTPSEGHDHCQLCPVSRTTAAVERPALNARVAVAVIAIEAAPPAAPAPSIDVVRIAPKTSPPV